MNNITNQALASNVLVVMLSVMHYPDNGLQGNLCSFWPRGHDLCNTLTKGQC